MGRRRTSSSSASGPASLQVAVGRPVQQQRLAPLRHDGAAHAHLDVTGGRAPATPLDRRRRRSSSSTASGIRSGSSSSSLRCSRCCVSSSAAPPSSPVVVSLPPVTIVRRRSRGWTGPETASTPASTRCEMVSSPGSTRRRSISPRSRRTARPPPSVAASGSPRALAATIASVQLVELDPVRRRHAEVVGDDHARQGLEHVGHDVAATGGPQPFDPVDHERPHRRLDLGHLAGVNPLPTSRRNSVWSGGSSITIGGSSASPSASSSP